MVGEGVGEGGGMSLKLSDTELAILDGRCSPETQVAVEAAKARLAMIAELPDTEPPIAGFVADVVAYAIRNGRLKFCHRNLRSCNVCKRAGGYAKYKRSGRFHKKGDANFDAPLTFRGIDLSSGCVSIKGYASMGCCDDCWDKASPLLAEVLKNVEAEIPESVSSFPPQFRYYDNMICNSCGWKGHEGEMGELPAMFGGMYPGECPACSAQNLPLGSHVIKRANGHTVVPVVVEPTP